MTKIRSSRKPTAPTRSLLICLTIFKSKSAELVADQEVLRLLRGVETMLKP